MAARNDTLLQMAAQRLGIDRKLVRDVYYAYWRTIREHIESLPLKDDLNEDEFRGLVTSVSVLGIGKLNVQYGRYRNIKKTHYILKGREDDKHEVNKADEHQDPGNG